MNPAAQESGTIALGLIGGGFMGEAIIAGLLRVGASKPENMRVVEPVSERRAQLIKMHPGLIVEAEPDIGLARSDALLIAIKPQDFDHAAETLRPHLRADQL